MYEEKEVVNEELKKKYSALVLLKRIIKDAKPIAWALVLATILSIFSIAVWLVSPYVIGEATNMLFEYFEGRIPELNMKLLINSCITLAVCYVVKALVDTGKMALMNHKVSRFYTAGFRTRLSDKITRLPVNFVDTTPYGEIVSRMMNDVGRLGSTIHMFINMATMGVIQIVAIAVILFTYNWILALICILSLPISITIAGMVASRARKHLSARQKSVGELYSHIEEHYAGFSTIKVYNQERIQGKKNRGIINSMVSAESKGVFLAEIVDPVIVFTNNFCYVAICVIGGYFALNGNMGMTVGSIVSIMLYARYFSSPLVNIAFSLSSFQRVMASARRVYDILDRPEMEVKAVPDHFEKVEGNVEFKNIEFSYGEKPLIKDLSFKVKSGQKVAIVGPTGGGKTTLVNLLMRFYEIKSGQILVDGVDIKDITREELREQFSMVLQDTWLFNGTIMENIAYGKEGATDEEIIEACDAAYCDHFIRSFPEGYQTIVHNDISSVSAGQKQLLTIARAFLANRKILILDEATSNIDTRTEVLIQKAMDKLMKNRTSFVIAHRLSTIIDADLILVINNGDIVETGTHKELLERGGFYKEIYQSQYSLVNAEL